MNFFLGDFLGSKTLLLHSPIEDNPIFWGSWTSEYYPHGSEYGEIMEIIEMKKGSNLIRIMWQTKRVQLVK